MKKSIFIAFPSVTFVLIVALAAWSEYTINRDSGSHVATAAQGTFDDPVCHMHIGTGIATEWEGEPYFFCSERCKALFEDDPKSYLTAVCLVCKSEGTFTSLGESSEFTAIWQGTQYTFCTVEHRDAFREDPAGYFLHTMWGIPNWLYYSSIAFIMALSFGVFEIGPGHQTDQKPARVNLFGIVGLRRFVKHPLTRFGLRLFFVMFFILIIAAGLFGTQISSDNIAPLLTWTIWWGGLVLLILYTGSAWCYVCPWDAIADWAEGLRVWGIKKNGLGLGLKVPKRWQNIWIAIVLFTALTWVELGFGVTMSPRATAWMALAILGAAVMSAFIFERKAFCRYACPVGRIIGIYSLFAPVEVRAASPEVCRKCRTQSCYKGNDQGEACPTSLYIPAMRENTNCLNCMECVKSCESDNVAVNTRPWGADFAQNHRVRADEAAMALLLLVLAAFHGLTMTGLWREFLVNAQQETGLSHTLTFSLAMFILMLIPCLIYAVLIHFSYRLGGSDTYSYRDYFIRYAYTLLPIALFYHLAHNSEHLLMEGQKIIALTSDPFGWGWDLFQTADWTLPPLISLKTLWMIQVSLVVMGHVYSLWAARSVAHRMFPNGKAASSQFPMLAAMILFSIISLWLLKQPMEMRSSSM